MKTDFQRCKDLALFILNTFESDISHEKFYHPKRAKDYVMVYISEDYVSLNMKIKQEEYSFNMHRVRGKPFKPSVTMPSFTGGNFAD